jgi:NADPH:quinone reductase-like Zn-dependent oxidoreductase
MVTSFIPREIFAGALTVVAGLALATTPAQQRAIVQTGTGGPEVLRLQTVPVLEPAAGQVLIKVYAAAVNPEEWKEREGTPGESRAVARSIPGRDVAGVIESVGKGVRRFKVGDKVVSAVSRDVPGLNGAYAEYAIAVERNVIPKPRSMSFEEASGLGIAAMTAAHAFNQVNIRNGQRVFIRGAGGGVGSAVAQMAKARGAYVIGTAPANRNDYLRSIGVDEVVDYSQVRFEAVVKPPVDVVIETSNSEPGTPDTATRALKILAKGGTLVSVARMPSAGDCQAAGVRCISSDRDSAGEAAEGALLAQVGRLAEQGKFKVNVVATYPLEKAADAQEDNRRDSSTRSKIVIDVVPGLAGQK